MNYRNFVYAVVGILCLGLIVVALMVVWVDPFFHFHRPLKEFYYTLKSERYQNDGILRNFDYDAIITGTSMTANFKTTEFDKLFGVKSVKIAFPGSDFNETNYSLERAYTYNKEITLVVRSIDLNNLIRVGIDSNIDSGSEYLLNDNTWDDVSYVLNKDAFLKYVIPAVVKKIKGNKGGITDFDSYSNWNDKYEFGEQFVLERREKVNKDIRIQKDRNKAKKYIEENIVNIAREHPETKFYYFFPPYSKVWWKERSISDNLDYIIDLQRLTIEMCLQCPNVKIFQFDLMQDITMNLDNYMDSIHYGEWINSKILEYMKSNVGLITVSNYDNYLSELYILYSK